ncbi:hypothetical protein BLOT_011437 [Blomia tropicalis]|nr:hypothetical protein BLOT_011437 [Blomia tropicalis]
MGPTSSKSNGLIESIDAIYLVIDVIYIVLIMLQMIHIVNLLNSLYFHISSSFDGNGNGGGSVSFDGRYQTIDDTKR